MGSAGALLPVWVKEHFADRRAFAAGVYATAISIGATTAPAVAVPLAHALGGWRAPLIAFTRERLAAAPRSAEHPLGASSG